MSLLSFTAAAQDQSHAVTIEPIADITKTIGDQPIILPRGEIEVVASIYNIPPGADLPVHRHGYPRYGYVLEGQLQVTNEETGKTSTFSVGDFVSESVGQWHTGTNPGSSLLKLLVIDQMPKGESNVELEKQSP